MSIVNTSTTCSRCERQLDKKIGKVKSDAKKRMQILQGQKTLNRVNSSGNLGVSQNMRSSKMHQSQVWQNQNHSQMGNERYLMHDQYPNSYNPHNFQNNFDPRFQPYPPNSYQYMSQNPNYPYPPNYHQYPQNMPIPPQYYSQNRSFYDNQPFYPNQNYQMKRNYPGEFMGGYDNNFRNGNCAPMNRQMMNSEMEFEQEHEDNEGNMDVANYQTSQMFYKQSRTTDSLDMSNSQVSQYRNNRSTSLNNSLKRREFREWFTHQ